VYLTCLLEEFHLVTNHLCSITPQGFAATHHGNHYQSWKCCKTYSFWLIFSPIDDFWCDFSLVVLLLNIHYLAAKHTNFWGVMLHCDQKNLH